MRNRKSRRHRFLAALKVAAILFLFAFVCLSAARDSSRKQPGHAKGAVFAVTLRDSAKSKSAALPKAVSKRESAPSFHDSAVSKKNGAAITDTLAVHSADSLKSSALTRNPDSASRILPSVITDTAKRSAFRVAGAKDSFLAHHQSKAEGVSNTPAASRSLSAQSNKRSHVRLMYLIISAAVIASAAPVVLSARKRMAGPRFLTTTRLSVMDKEVQRACRHIELHYNDPELNAKSVCEAIITGEAFLEAIMQRDLGVSVSEFITHVRINRARGILQENAETSKETIASQTGFPNVQEFEDAFRKVTGHGFEAFLNS